MLGRYRLRQGHPCAAALLFAVLLVAGCAGNPQQGAAQFGQAVTTVVGAQNALFDAIDQKQTDFYAVHVLTSRYLAVQPDGSVRPKTDTGPAGPAIPADVRKAIDGVLTALQAYGQGMQALAGDTAAATFDTNTDTLAKSVASFDTGTLAPLGVRSLPSTSEVNSVGSAVKSVGNVVIGLLIDRDVQAAARSAQQPLHTIAGALKTINGYWTRAIPQNLSLETAAAAVSAWNAKDLSIGDRLALQAIWQKAAQPVKPDAANAALDAMVAANDKIAAAGVNLSTLDIASAVQAAKQAYANYKALLNPQPGG
jgi:hypothetical protein